MAATTRLLTVFKGLIRTPARRVALATTYSQLVLIAVIPLLTRLYDLDTFSSYQVAFALAAVLQLALSGGVEYVIPTLRYSREREHSKRRGGIFCIAISAGGGALILTFLLVGYVEAASIGLAALTIGIALALTNIDNSVLLAEDQIAGLVRRNLLAGSLAAVLQVGLAEFGSLWTLAGSVVVGRIVAVTLVRPAKPTGTTENRQVPVSSQRARDGSFWVVSILLSNGALQLPVLMASIASGTVAAAQLAVATRIVGVLSSLLGTGVSQGFVYNIGRLRRGPSSDVAAYVRKRQRTLVLISVLAGVLLSGVGLLGVPIVLGPDWRTAGVITTILAVPFSLQLVNRVTAPIFPVLKRSVLHFYLQLARAFAVLVVCVTLQLLIAVPIEIFSGALSLTMLVFYAAFYSVVYRIAGGLDAEPSKAPLSELQSSELSASTTKNTEAQSVKPPGEQHHE